MTVARVVGLDLSLGCTGVALPDGTSTKLMPPRLAGMERLIWLRDNVIDAVIGPFDAAGTLSQSAELVALEGYAMGSKRQSHSYAIGELGGVVRLALHEYGIPIVEISPASLKVFATGKGNASKDEVLAEAIRRLGYQGANNDEADALWLRAMAIAAYGGEIVELPKSHLRALDKIEWPTIDPAAAA